MRPGHFLEMTVVHLLRIVRDLSEIYTVLFRLQKFHETNDNYICIVIYLQIVKYDAQLHSLHNTNLARHNLLI